MSVQQTAVVLPYTSVDQRVAEIMSGLIGPLHLFQPAAMEPTTALAGLAEAGMVVLERPDSGRLDKGRVLAAVSEFRSWIDGARDVSDLSHLRGAMIQSEGPATSGLMSAIRTYGRDNGADDPLPDHVLLHIAAEYDRARAEMHSTMDRVRGFEAGLGRAMGLKADEFEDGPEEMSQALDPLAVPEVDLDPLIGLRLKAWSALYRAEPINARAWLTGPTVIRHFNALLSEAGQEEPVPLADLALEGLNRDVWSQVWTAAEQGRAGEKAVAEDEAGPRVRLWSFPPVMMANVLGLAADAWSGMMVEVAPWR